MVVAAGQVEHREEGEEVESKSVGMRDSYSTEGMPYCFTLIQYPVTCMYMYASQCPQGVMSNSQQLTMLIVTSLSQYTEKVITQV